MLTLVELALVAVGNVSLISPPLQHKPRAQDKPTVMRCIP